MYTHIALLWALAAGTLAIAEPMVTAAAQLKPRQSSVVDPALVGYITTNGAYTNVRTCDYPQTVSTSGNYVQCCSSTGSCNFFTSCSANTLFGPSGTVNCYVNSALTCNTAIVLATPSATNSGSYLACWQTSLGTSPFTFVQQTPAGAGASTLTGGGMGTSTSLSSPLTVSTGGSSSGGSGSSGSGSATAASSSSSSRNAADEVSMSSGGIVGLLALLAQALL